jgi:hypothetical protein
MALTLRKRSRPDATPNRPADGVAHAEHAAMSTLARTLRELAAGLPPESRLAGEYARIARSIDVSGVLGTWRLDAMTRELAESVSERAAAAGRSTHASAPGRESHYWRWFDRFPVPPARSHIAVAPSRMSPNATMIRIQVAIGPAKSAPIRQRKPASTGPQYLAVPASSRM